MPRDESVVPEIRRLHGGEIEWALSLADRCYKRKLSRKIWVPWVEMLLNRPDVLVLRGNESIVVCILNRESPDAEYNQGIFKYWFHEGPNPRELIRACEIGLSWMRSNHARTVLLSSDTDASSAPIAHALGFKPYECFQKDLLA